MEAFVCERSQMSSHVTTEAPPHCMWPVKCVGKKRLSYVSVHIWQLEEGTVTCGSTKED